MLLPTRKKVLAFTSALILTTAYSATATAQDTSFWDGGSDGWFFYEPDPPPPEEPEEPEPPKLPPVVNVTPPPEPPPEPEEPEPPEYLSALWLKENLPRYHRAALDNPGDVETVAVYAYLKRIALDKAEEFTRTYQDAMLAYPALDENTNRPTASFASKAIENSRAEARQSLLRKINDRTVGLFFFYKDDCDVCVSQTQPLEWIKRRGGFDVQPISIDGAPILIKGFENFKVDTGQAEMLGMIAAPAIYLVIDSQNIVSVGQGGTSAPDLVEAIISQANMNNIITQEEYETTLSGTFNPLGQAFNDLAEQQGVRGDSEGYIEPKEFFEIIKRDLIP